MLVKTYVFTLLIHTLISACKTNDASESGKLKMKYSIDSTHPFKHHVVSIVPKRFSFKGILKQVCNGIRVKQDLILAPAHCVSKNNTFFDFKLYLRFSRGPELVTAELKGDEIRNVAFHSKFIDGNAYHDIALIYIHPPETVRKDFDLLGNIKDNEVFKKIDLQSEKFFRKLMIDPANYFADTTIISNGMDTSSLGGVLRAVQLPAPLEGNARFFTNVRYFDPNNSQGSRNSLLFSYPTLDQDLFHHPAEIVFSDSGGPVFTKITPQLQSRLLGFIVGHTKNDPKTQVAIDLRFYKQWIACSTNLIKRTQKAKKTCEVKIRKI